jgi:DNA-binding CsgD family transcriptional regulator
VTERDGRRRSAAASRAAASPAAARNELSRTLTYRLRRSGSTAALDVLRTAAATLVGTVSADIWCAVMLDPATFLDTGGEHEHGFPQRVMPRLFEIEHTEQAGVDNIRALATRSTPASLLSRSSGGRMDDSVYYRDVLRPLDLADELRVLLRDGSRTWGLLVLCRHKDSPPFTAAEVALAGAFSTPATVELRRSLLLSGIDRGDVPDAAGLVVLDARHEVRLMTATAERWLDLVQEFHPTAGLRHPLALTALVSRASAAAPGVQVQSRAISRTGTWITLSAWRERSGGEGGEMLTYVSLAASSSDELTPIVLDAYGLTPRERQVAQQVLMGHSTTEAAARLHMAEYTLQDHLRKVFSKAGVRSRREFTGDLFRRFYLPHLEAAPLTKDGRMRSE